MSKSLGNGIDPLEVIEKYGADALRFTLATGDEPWKRHALLRREGQRPAGNFANKIWNASRFVAMNLEGQEIPRATLEPEHADVAGSAGLSAGCSR